MPWIKNTIKHYFSRWIHRRRMAPEVGVQQRLLMQHYLVCKQNGQLPDIRTTGFKVFSQFEEDGLLLYLFSIIGEGSKTFVEIGANDGINSNCSNLIIHFGWTGLMLEGDARRIRRGQRFYSKVPSPYHPKPTFVQAIVQRENINELLTSNGIQGEIELLSIDIDGNDYWVWDAITAISPKVVIIETHTEFGLNNIVVPYDPLYMYPGVHPVYHGASTTAMNALAQKKGYRLVAASDLGINQIFVRNDVAPDLIPAIDPASTLWHPKTQEGFELFEPIKGWDYLSGE